MIPDISSASIADVEGALQTLYEQHSKVMNAADLTERISHVSEIQTTLLMLVDKISFFEDSLRDKRLEEELSK